MTPNIILHPTFGKFLFSFFDLLVGTLIYMLLRNGILPNAFPSLSSHSLEQKATLYASLHLFNPMVFSISTRGSSESIINALVLGTLYFATIPTKTQKIWDTTAFMLGLAVHWKIYPVIYGIGLLVLLVRERAASEHITLGDMLSAALSKRGLRLGTVSFGTFMALNGVMYLM